MRRKQFVQLVGLNEKALNLLVERGLLPLRGKASSTGWASYTIDDALALEAAVSLSRLGSTKARARDFVNSYFDVAIEQVRDVYRPLGTQVYLGAVSYVSLQDGLLSVDDYWPLVGTPIDIAQEIDRLSHAVGPQRWLEGAITANLHLCMAAISQRARKASISSDRLIELEQWFER